MADKKLNPRFIMGANKSNVEKQLDQIATAPKRVVRRDWSKPAIASADHVEDVDIKPNLANNEVAIDFGDDVSDGVEHDFDDEAGEVGEGSVPVKPVSLSSEVVDKLDTTESVSFDSGEDDTVNVQDSASDVVVEPVKPVRRVNPAFNLGVESKPKVPQTRFRDEEVIEDDTSDTDFSAKSGTEAALGETSATLSRSNVLRPGKLPGKKPAPSFLGGRVTRPAEDRSQYGVDDITAVPVRKAFPAAKPETEHKDQRPHVLKAKSGVEAGDWTDDTSKDTNRGFGGEGNLVKIEPELGVGFHLTERDILIIRFLARYRYAYAFQIARLVNASVKSVNPRLKKLAERGFIRKQTVTGNQHIWLSTKAGNLVTDIDLPAIKEGTLSWVTVAHTLGLVNVGVELEIGGDNLLKEAVWPTMNRSVGRNEYEQGERVITEKEIRQGQQKWRMNRTTLEMRELVESAIKETGNAKPHPLTGEMGFPDAPELIEGNEGLFVIYGQVEHIPDMVVSRGRDADGKPINIAIELELNAKTTEDWRRILRTYRDFGQMYDKVIYFTHKRTIFNLLNKINNEDIGLPSDKFMIRQYVPKNGREPFWG